VVAGPLPPFLAGLVAGYYPVQVVGYDAAREGDVDDTTRIVVGSPITVTVS
jgi:alpha-galactosidase/6-phospho-beta-glucosidase family protein